MTLSIASSVCQSYVHKVCSDRPFEREARLTCSCGAGVCDADDLRLEHSESDAVELGRLLFWLMVVGYRCMPELSTHISVSCSNAWS